MVCLDFWRTFRYDGMLEERVLGRQLHQKHGTSESKGLCYTWVCCHYVALCDCLAAVCTSCSAWLPTTGRRKVDNCGFLLVLLVAQFL